MSLDKAAVTKIAKLARIHLKEDEKDHYAREISGILKWVEQLQEVNTEDVPQMTSVVSMPLPMRRDEVTDGHIQEKIIANAPGGAEFGCFVVPKVIE